MTAVHRDDAEPSALTIAQQEMRPGERLIWADRPAPRRMVLSGLVLTAFGAVFAGFAAFWIAAASSMVPDDFGVFAYFPLFGIPFLLIGLAIMLAPVWIWMTAKKTIYAISSDRLVIMIGRRVRSIEPDEIESLERREDADGGGDIIFRRDLVRSHSRHHGRTRERKVGFFGIAEVRRVEDEIRRLKDRARD